MPNPSPGSQPVRLIPGWRREMTRLWSMRVGLFFAVLNAAMYGVAGMAGFINPWLFFWVNLIGWSVLLVARLLKQPGADV